MKKLKLTGKLSLNKETISKLNDDEMNGVHGGGSQFYCETQVRGCISVYVACDEQTVTCAETEVCVTTSGTTL